MNPLVKATSYFLLACGPTSSEYLFVSLCRALPLLKGEEALRWFHLPVTEASDPAQADITFGVSSCFLSGAPLEPPEVVQGLGPTGALVTSFLSRQNGPPVPLDLSSVPAQTFFGKGRNSIDEGDIAASFIGD